MHVLALAAAAEQRHVDVVVNDGRAILVLREPPDRPISRHSRVRGMPSQCRATAMYNHTVKAAPGPNGLGPHGPDSQVLRQVLSHDGGLRLADLFRQITGMDCIQRRQR